MKPILGIFLGEAAGVGPEIIAKLVAEKVVQEYCRPVLIGDVRVLQLGQKIAKVDFPFVRVSHVKEINWEGPVSILDLKNFDPETLKMGEINSISGKATGDALVYSMEYQIY